MFIADILYIKKKIFSCSRLIEDIEIRNKNLSENKLCLESIKNDCDYMNQEFSKAENAYLTIEKVLV